MKKIIALAACLFFASYAIAQDEEAIPERGGQGTVTIVLEPAGSEVYLDGEFLGKAPIIKKEFRSGRFDLYVIDQEQELINERFNVFQNQENVYKGKTVMPFGNINVDIGNKKCDVSIDGEYAARTDGGPLLIRNLDAGDHLVEVKCAGRKMDHLVKVPGEATVDVIFDMAKKTVEVK